MAKIEEDQQIIAWMLNSATQDKGYRCLMDKYQQKLYWQIKRMIFDADDVEDVMQNTFIRVFRSIEQFEQKSSLFTWMYRIATNECLSFLEKKKKHSADSIEGGGETGVMQIKSDSYFDGDEAQAILQAAILELPEKQRAVFNMRYFEDLPYSEMSKLLNTSEGALKASFHHAIKKIEEFVKKKNN